MRLVQHAAYACQCYAPIEVSVPGLGEHGCCRSEKLLLAMLKPAVCSMERETDAVQQQRLSGSKHSVSGQERPDGSSPIVYIVPIG